MGNYETLKMAGYKYIKYMSSTKVHILEIDGKKEMFVSSKYFAGWALIYKNTHLEFVGSYNGE